MKQILAVLLLLGAVACKSSNANRTAGTQASVTKTSGSAEFLNAGVWESIRTGQALNEGDQARTGADGQIDIRFSPHGGVMTVMPNSAIEIEKLRSDGTNKMQVATIRLGRGRVTGDTLKLPTGSKVMIKTSGGSFAIP